MQSEYILKRLALGVVTVFGVTLILFFLLRLLPGDPVTMMVPIGTTQEEIDQIRRALGLDRSPPEQYILWINNLLHGELGNSLKFGLPVSYLLKERLPATLELVITSIIVGLVLGIALTIIPFLKKSTWIETAVSGYTFTSFAIPNFVWAIILIITFGAIARMLPVTGRIDAGVDLTTVTGFYTLDSIITGNSTAFLSVIKHLILPVGALSFRLLALVQRTLSSSLKEVLEEDYILTERAKGLSERYVVVSRGLRNAIIPMITVVGVQIAFLFGGSIIIELVFNWNGLGSLAFEAIGYRDLPLIEGLVLVYTIIVMVINLGIDLLYSAIDPRVRY